MASGLAGRQPQSEFARLHKLFVEHLGFAVMLAWMASAVAARNAPWLSNIRGLIDPSGRVESTSSFLFVLPVLLLAAWLAAFFGADAMWRMRVLRNQALEFGFAGAVAFGIFCMAIDRAVTAFLLGT